MIISVNEKILELIYLLDDDGESYDCTILLREHRTIKRHQYPVTDIGVIHTEVNHH